MATSFEPIKFANLTEKTTAPSDADIIVIEESTATKKAKWSNLISWIKSKLNIGSADISSIGDGTVTGAVSALNTKINASMVQLVATTTAGAWMNFNVPSLTQYRYIIFCINDGNMSQFPPVIYPISIFKTCNSTNRTAMLSEYDTIKCYACYNSDIQVGLYIGGSGRQITVYGVQ